ncbi:scavenger receptor cysteine-rich domain-containing protein DMBT1-like isoform X1 [Narcine bancroftii]|uniref:scavenger receptor cysteine-rich domain-containing protein DMBT1-like isoform X1 n=1 Tax=Narcine bancroftii TaxID=1343680 RepID=UPI00383221D3
MTTGRMLRPFLILMRLIIWNYRLRNCLADRSESDVLRLVNGGSPCAGRVEVSHQGVWGTVDDYGWDMNDAAVVCRQTGCGSALKAPRKAHFGPGTGPVVTWNVRCTGRETALRKCPSEPWASYGWSHNNDVGVICSEHRVPRLVSGYDRCSGRLEVMFGDTWYTICDAHWDMDDADVVCRHLQCGVAVSMQSGAYFEEGTPSKRSLECNGEELFLSDCPLSAGTHHCSQRNGVDVICTGNHGPRLVGGKNRCSGRVEILHGDQWWTLCEAHFSLEGASVICEQLQCGAVIGTPSGAQFGEETGPMWKEGYRCQGNESRIADCPFSPLDNVRCSRGNISGLICSDESWSLRLTNGGSRCDGRVEVYHNGSWGRVQDHVWSINDSNVVCAELGCGSAISAYNSSIYGESERPVWVNEVQCEGTESQLRNCNTFALNYFSSNSRGVGVLCSGHLQVRLSDGGDLCAGRLEIYYNGTWGTVCDDSWDAVDSNVVCRHLGCGTALEKNRPRYCGRSSGPVWLDEVRCLGNESYLWECLRARWGDHDCTHKEDVTITCSEHKEMRLKNGGHRCEGRVEVLYNGTWGTVCSDGMNWKAVDVICKQLKCGPGKSLEIDAVKYGEGSGQIWLDELDCTSHESTLWQCKSASWGEHDCQHKEDAAVVCEEAQVPEGSDRGKVCLQESESEIAELSLRLVGGSNSCSGRLEILWNDRSGTVCDDSWDLADADVVCRQLRCGPARWTPGAATIDNGHGDILLDEVKCTGSESLLSSCPSSQLGQHDCDHKEDVIVFCSDPFLSETGSTDSGDKTPSIIVAVCITLGVLLFAELIALMTIVQRRSGRRAALMRGRGSAIAFYETIYEDIDNTLTEKNFSHLHGSASGSIDFINQIDYYTSDPSDAALLEPEPPHENSSRLYDIGPVDSQRDESKIIDCQDCRLRAGSSADDPLALTVVHDPNFLVVCSSDARDNRHNAKFIPPVPT